MMSKHRPYLSQLVQWAKTKGFSIEVKPDGYAYVRDDGITIALGTSLFKALWDAWRSYNKPGLPGKPKTIKGDGPEYMFEVDRARRERR